MKRDTMTLLWVVAGLGVAAGAVYLATKKPAPAPPPANPPINPE